MKKLFYEIEAYTSVYNTETEEIEEVLSPVGVVVYNPTNADIAQAKATAYNGECTIEDDGEPEPVPAGEPVTWDELDAAYQEGVDSV